MSSHVLLVELNADKFGVRDSISWLFLAYLQSVQFSVIAVLHHFSGLKKITNLHMSCRKFLGVSIAVKNTTIGFKI
jgi:hypothetical protein